MRTCGSPRQLAAAPTTAVRRPLGPPAAARPPRPGAEGTRPGLHWDGAQGSPGVMSSKRPPLTAFRTAPSLDPKEPMARAPEPVRTVRAGWKCAIALPQTVSLDGRAAPAGTPRRLSSRSTQNVTSDTRGGAFLWRLGAVDWAPP